MFHHLKGVVTELAQTGAVVECCGVGFYVNVSARTLAQLSAGRESTLYIYEQVREDAFELYGFASKAERSCFEMLLSVSGVGPKAALSILSANTPEGLCMAILSEDERALTVASGVGKKLAQRVILELRDKMRKQAGDFSAVSDAGGFSLPAGESGSASAGKLSEAAAALGVLGYSSTEAAAALRGVELSQPVEGIIRAALRNMVN